MAEILQSLFIFVNVVVAACYVWMPASMWRIRRRVQGALSDQKITVPRAAVLLVPGQRWFVGFVASCGIGHAIMAYTSSGFHPTVLSWGLVALVASHTATAIISTGASLHYHRNVGRYADSVLDMLVGRAGRIGKADRAIADMIHDAQGWLYKMNIATGELLWSWGAFKLFHGIEKPDRYGWYRVDYKNDWSDRLAGTEAQQKEALLKAQAVLSFAQSYGHPYFHTLRYQDPPDEDGNPGEEWLGPAWGGIRGGWMMGFGGRAPVGMEVGDNQFAWMMGQLKRMEDGL